MRRTAILLPLLALGVGATALAQDEPSGDPAEPKLRPRQVFKLPGGCRPGEKVTVRVNPSGASFATVRVYVSGLDMVELRGVNGPASVTVRIPRDPTRVSATGETRGGQELYRTHVYGRCRQPVRFQGEEPVVGREG